MTDKRRTHLEGRKMLHTPWRTAPERRRRLPVDSACPGTVIRRIVGTYLDASADGRALVVLLNRHLPDGFVLESVDDLLAVSRCYSLEFYLYIICFTKILSGDLELRYKPTDDEILGTRHMIIERGPMTMKPWYTDGNELPDAYISIANVTSIFTYVEHALPRPPYAEGDTAEICGRISEDGLALLNEWILEDYRIDRSFFTREEILISYEFLFYSAGIFGALSNDPQFTSKALYYGFRQNRNLARAVFLQPVFSPAEGLRRWQMWTNNVYKFEFIERRRSVLVGVSLRRLKQMGTFGDYGGSCVDGVKQGISGAHRAFVELASGRRARTRVIDRAGISSDFYVKSRFKAPLNTGRLMIASGLTGAAVIGGASWTVLTGIGSWATVLAAGMGFVVLAGSTAMALYWKNRLDRMATRFDEAQEIIKGQLTELQTRTDELLQERDTLEEHVAERTKELRIALDQVRRLDSAKTGFLATISHELRTPLTLLTLPFDEIRKGRWGQVLPNDHPMFALIERNILRIRNQVTRLLDFTRLDLGTVEHHPAAMDLLAYTRVLLAEISSYAEHRGLELSLAEPTALQRIIIEADPSLLETLVLNLLFNALKFTREGRVWVEFEEMGGSYIRMAVRDTGIGIPAEERDRIFERFTQAEEHRDRHHEGTGLGLSLVKEIADLHNWELELESESGAGSSFMVTMPLLPEESEYSSWTGPGDRKSILRSEFAQTTGPARMAPDGRKDTILIVEDNPDMGTLIQDLLSDTYNVHWCGDGRQALEYLSESPPPSLIVCDVMMPGMDGFDFIRDWSNQEDRSDIPVVFLSALDAPGDRIAGLACGAVDYITKPFTRDELLMKVGNLLNVRSASYLRAVRDREGLERLKRIAGAVPKENEEADWVRFGITPAERRVVMLLTEGLQDKEIADRLNLSPRTVSAHLSHVYEKTNTQNRVELVQTLFPRFVQ